MYTVHGFYVLICNRVRRRRARPFPRVFLKLLLGRHCCRIFAQQRSSSISCETPLELFTSQTAVPLLHNPPNYSTIISRDSCSTNMVTVLRKLLFRQYIIFHVYYNCTIKQLKINNYKRIRVLFQFKPGVKEWRSKGRNNNVVVWRLETGTSSILTLELVHEPDYLASKKSQRGRGGTTFIFDFST